MANFDTETLKILSKAGKIAIRTAKHPETAVLVWVAVEDGEVFVRSARGLQGRWHRDLILGGDGTATIGVADHRLAVKAVPAADALSLDRARRGYRRKHGGSPYLASVLKPEVMQTTLRLEPI